MHIYRFISENTLGTHRVLLRGPDRSIKDINVEELDLVESKPTSII